MQGFIIGDVDGDGYIDVVVFIVFGKIFVFRGLDGVFVVLFFFRMYGCVMVFVFLVDLNK